MDDAGEAMQRAMDRTKQMQAKAAAVDGLMASGALSDPLDPRSQMDREMDKLRESGGVDADLARLKAEMAKGSTPEGKAEADSDTASH
jgi:phage shock protein A